MIRRGMKVIAAVCVILGLVLPARTAAQQLHIRTYSEADGLPGNSVRCVTQTSDGVMWFSTRAGVVSYDGGRWQRHPLPGGPPPGGTRLIVDASDRLWAVPFAPSRRVWYLAGRRWERVDAGPVPWSEESLVALAALPDGARYLLLAASPTMGLAGFDGQAWHAVATHGIPLGTVRAVVTAGRTCYIVSDCRVLTWSDPDGAPQVVLEVQPGFILGAATDPRSGDLWLITRESIASFSGAGLRVVRRLDRAPLPNYEYRVLMTTAGRLYFGELSQVFTWKAGEAVTLLGRSSGLIADDALSLFEDREGVVWLGSYRGLSKLINRRFTGYDRRSGLLADEVTVVFQRRSGQIVLGGPTGLTFMSDPPEVLPLAGHPEQGRVMAIAEDDAGRLWVAVNWCGLARVDDIDTVQWIDDGLADSITAVEYQTGQLWVGTGRGLFVADGPTDFARIEQVPEVYVRRLTADPAGGIYVATGDCGVFRIHGDTVEHFRHVEHDGANNTYGVHVDAAGTAWVATRAGLFTLADGAVVEVPGAAPAVTHPVYFILSDHDDRLWLGTDRGAAVWDGRALRSFTVADGLIGAECNRAGGLCAVDGRVWIGTERGVSVYDPREDHPPGRPPLLRFAGLDAGGRRLDPTAPVTLQHDRSAVRFDLQAISFIDEARTRLRTWMEGLQDEWGTFEPLPDRTVRFPYLPPGSYRLHAQALSVDGALSAVATSPWVHVRPPFWQAGWFRALAAAAGAILVFAIGVLMAGRRHTARLENQVSERTAALQVSRAEVMTEKERLDVALASITDGVAATDLHGRVTIWNPAAARLTGVDAPRATGQPLSRLLPLTVADAADWLGAILSGDASSVAETCRVPDRRGAAREFEFSAAPLRTGTQIHGAVVAFRDVSARRRRAQEQATAERLSSLGVLAGGIAHDFNNLLTVVVSSLSMAEADPSSAQLQAARTASEQARGLARRLLTFARGGAPLREAVDLVDLVRARVAAVAEGSAVSFVVETAPDLPAIDADPVQLGQAISNVLLNARAVSPAGGRVRVAVDSGAPPPPAAADRVVSIRVSDDGPGIPAEHLERIFDPFFTTGAHTSGLGLSVAYSIVERHGGTLTVVSAPGAGATFEITLPAGVPAVATPSTGQGAGPQGARLLLMDDHPAVRQIVAATLESLGFEVDTAADGQAAVDRYRAACACGAPYAAVILDLTVRGGMGGAEAVGHLRRIDPDVRAIAASGYAADPIMADAEAHGFCARLVKPFGAPDLAEVLARVLPGVRP